MDSANAIDLTSQAPALPRTRAAIAALAAWRYFDAVVLATAVVAITGVNLVWTALDSHRLFWDFSRHLGNSLAYKDAFSLEHPSRFFDTYLYANPPFVYWVTDAFYAVFGTDLDVAILSNVVFLAVLVYATYGIGAHLWSRRVGFLSTLFVVTSPLFVSQLKWYMLDAPLSAMVALALYLVIRSESFASRRYSLLLGVACGLGALTKWPFVLFLALPAAFAIVGGVGRARTERATTRLVNIGLAAAVAFVIASVWYLPNLTHFVRDLRAATGIPPSVMGAPPVGSLSAWLWYFWDLLNNGLYLVPFLFFVAGVAFLFTRDASAERNLPLVLSVVGGYFAFSLIQLKDFRYVMPMIPPIAVIATHWLDYLGRRARALLGGGLAVYGAAAFFVISFGTGLLPHKIAIPLKARSYTSNILLYAPPESERVKGIVVFKQQGYVLGKPSSERWYQNTIFDRMSQLASGYSFAYLGPPDETWFQTWGIRYYALQHHAAWIADPAQADFLIVRGTVPSGVTTGFTQIARYPLPYSGPLRLYEHV